jgi:hypothetical protein
VGLRRLLNRQAAAERPVEPLTWLAELGRAEDAEEQGGTRPPPFADQATRSGAPPLSPVAVDKTAAEFSAVESKRPVERRRIPSYVWVSQASRDRRASWADMPERF